MEQLNFTAVTTNFSNISSTLAPLQVISGSSKRLVPGIVLSLCFVLGVPGNLAVIVFLWRNSQQLSSLSRSLMLNLAVSDLMCLITLPLWSYALLNTWIFGSVTCKVLTYVLYCGIYGSLLSVTTLSIQRYLQVVWLQNRLNQVGQRGILVLLWIMEMILAIPAVIFRQLVKNDGWTYCQTEFSSDAQELAFLLTEVLLGFIFPFSIMAFAYIRLHYKVNQTEFFNNPRMTRLVTSITVIFFVLWIPYHIVNVTNVAAILLRNQVLLKSVMGIRKTVGALTFVNSCLDPLLYAFASKNICTACGNV
ncbi:CX3C chemokine receptor 1-like [Myripristis murdjan]|uniref:CX3C chemokine receptor 1-like n=1 Tax=Myripristis murdjan TaxID=586833 RepID=UPI0011764117|nr:CX3C chemokine receptor 1-like [Myripristis murdjan]